MNQINQITSQINNQVNQINQIQSGPYEKKEKQRLPVKINPTPSNRKESSSGFNQKKIKELNQKINEFDIKLNIDNNYNNYKKPITPFDNKRGSNRGSTKANSNPKRVQSAKKHSAKSLSNIIDEKEACNIDEYEKYKVNKKLIQEKFNHNPDIKMVEEARMVIPNPNQNPKENQNQNQNPKENQNINHKATNLFLNDNKSSTKFMKDLIKSDNEYNKIINQNNGTNLNNIKYENIDLNNFVNDLNRKSSGTGLVGASDNNNNKNASISDFMVNKNAIINQTNLANAMAGVNISNIGNISNISNIKSNNNEKKYDNTDNINTTNTTNITNITNTTDPSSNYNPKNVSISDFLINRKSEFTNDQYIEERIKDINNIHNNINPSNLNLKTNSRLSKHTNKKICPSNIRIKKNNNEDTNDLNFQVISNDNSSVINNISEGICTGEIINNDQETFDSFEDEAEENNNNNNNNNYNDYEEDNNNYNDNSEGEEEEEMVEDVSVIRDFSKDKNGLNGLNGVNNSNSNSNNIDRDDIKSSNSKADLKNDNYNYNQDSSRSRGNNDNENEEYVSTESPDHSVKELIELKEKFVKKIACYKEDCRKITGEKDFNKIFELYSVSFI